MDGNEQVNGNAQINLNEHIGGNAQVDGNANITGNVTIGANPVPGEPLTGNFANYQLSVDGQIAAKEVIVTTTNWQDTVFSKTYQLKSLVDVENYIKHNHHLSEIPDQQSVIRQGISLGEMNKLLLQKIEELTLYTINLEKRLQLLETK